jgi:hypothetical protein
MVQARRQEDAAGQDVAGKWSRAPAKAPCVAESFDVLLSDVAMPEVNGHELIRWVVACHPAVRCVAGGFPKLRCPPDLKRLNSLEAALAGGNKKTWIDVFDLDNAHRQSELQPFFPGIWVHGKLLRLFATAF